MGNNYSAMIFKSSYKKLREKQTAVCEICLLFGKQAMATSSLWQKEPATSAFLLSPCIFLSLAAKFWSNYCQWNIPGSFLNTGEPWVPVAGPTRALHPSHRVARQTTNMSAVSNSVKTESPQAPRMDIIFLPYCFGRSHQHSDRGDIEETKQKEKKKSDISEQFLVHFKFTCIQV